MLYFPLFILFIILTSLMCMIFNSWLIIWIMLEFNTLSFCSLMKDFLSSKKKNSEMSMKYFVVQSISSSILLFMVLWTKIISSIYFIVLFFAFISLMIKMASAPFQQWFVNMTKNIKWKNNFLLMTWQKIAPVYLLLYQMKIYLFPFIFLCAVMGAIFQYNKKSTMEILAFSSVFNLSWMLISIYLNMKIMIWFSLLYWASVFFLLYVFMKFNFWNVSKESNIFVKKWILFMLIINLAGIPPFLGFISKWIVFIESLLNNMIFSVTVVLMITCLNLYIYLRMFNYIMMKKSNFSQKNFVKVKFSFTSVVLILNFFPIIILMM